MRRVLFPVPLAAVLALAAPVAAQPFGDQGELRVNTATTGDQTDAALSVFISGKSYVVSWSSAGTSGTEIHAQRFTRPALPQGAEFVVNTYTTNNQGQSSVRYDILGGDFVISWDSYGQDGDKGGIWARRYSHTGDALSGPFRVNTDTAGDEAAPSLAGYPYSGTEAFQVVWTKAGGIWSQRYSSGVPLGTEFRINTYTTGTQKSPQSVKDSNAGFEVVWEGYGTPSDGDGTGIFGQRYSSAGSPLGTEFRVNTSTTGNQTHPAIGAACCLVVVAWESNGAGTKDVYAQKFSGIPLAAGGQPIGTEFRINTWTTGSQYNPKVAVSNGPSHSGFVVVWQTDQETGSGFDIYAQRFDSNGTENIPVGGEFRVNTWTTGNQVKPEVAFLTYSGAGPANDFIVTWQSQNQDGSGYAVMSKTFCYQQTGDADGNGKITVGDVFYLINNLFAGGPAPVFSADVNADGSVGVADVFLLINYLFAGGPAPACLSQLP
jgi:hypothetical protein